MNHIIYIFTLLACFSTQLFGMYTTFYKPTHWQEKPRFDRNNLTSYDLAYTHAWASSSFNDKGDKVPLLTFVNPEPLLPRFIDPKAKDNKPIAYALIDGQYSFDGIHNEIIQNIYQNFFIQFNVPLCKSFIKNLSFIPTDKCGNKVPCTEKISTYIDALYAKLFDSSMKEVQEKTYIGPTFLFFGYMNSFTNLKHADLLDISFRAGLIVPTIHLSGPELPVDLHGEIYNYGIPMQIQAMAGFYDWLNVGGALGAIVFFPNNSLTPVNYDPFPNKIILPNRELLQVFHHPILMLTTYIEGEHFFPHWTWYIGFNFVQHLKTTWNGCPEERNIKDLANKYPAIVPWMQGALTLSSEFDFGSKEKQLMPRLRIMYIKRLFGRDCFDASVFAGAVGFELIYDF